LVLWNPKAMEFKCFHALGKPGIEALKVEGFDSAVSHGRCDSGVESDFYVVFCPVQVEERL